MNDKLRHLIAIKNAQDSGFHSFAEELRALYHLNWPNDGQQKRKK